VVHGELFLFAALLLEPEQKPFPARVIVFDVQVHDGADPGERDPEERAVKEACVRGVSIACRSFWTSPSTNAGVLPSVRENLSVLTFRAGFMARIDVGRNRNRLDVFNAIPALRFLYRITLHKDWRLTEVVPTPQETPELPIVPSPEEVRPALPANRF
jgi:hypothetical protein